MTAHGFRKLLSRRWLTAKFQRMVERGRGRLYHFYHNLIFIFKGDNMEGSNIIRFIVHPPLSPRHVSRRNDLDRVLCGQTAFFADDGDIEPELTQGHEILIGREELYAVGIG